MKYAYYHSSLFLWVHTFELCVWCVCAFVCAQMCDCSHNAAQCLDSNQIAHIPNELGHIKSLTKLVLKWVDLLVCTYWLCNTHCALVTVRVHMCSCACVCWAYTFCSENKLTAVNSAICDLPNLQFLSLSSNQITELPSQIGQLTKWAMHSAYHCCIRTRACVDLC